MNKTLSIQGMSCNHCANAVTKELEKIVQVKAVEINLQKGIAIVELEDNIDDSILIEAVEEAGYKFVQFE